MTYTRKGGIVLMIISFADKETEKIFNQEYSRKLPLNIQKNALHKLVSLNAAQSIKELVVPPSNHLEKLVGDLENKWSIRINVQSQSNYKLSKQSLLVLRQA